MFKQSKFNIEVEVLINGDILIFNTLTNSFAIMNKSTQLLYNSIDTIVIEKLEDAEDKNNIELLVKQGYIISEEINELEMLKLRGQMSKYMNHKLILTIAPTLDCNMACPYCFENKQKIRMEEDVQENLYNFVVKSIDTRVCDHLHVTWYGGEPLLEVQIIYDLSKKFIDLCQEKKIVYTASIITNGVLLDRDIATKLKQECKIESAQVTIDGLPEYHNPRRLLIDGRNSFDIITNNIDNCKDLLKIYVRVNVDKENMDNLPKLTDYFLNEKGWNINPYFYVAPVVTYENNCDISPCLTGEEFGKLDYEVICRRNQLNPKEIRNELYPQQKFLACTAIQLGNYVVDPDGDLYTCLNVIGNKEAKIGNVKNLMSENSVYAKWLLYEPADKCTLCKLLPICGGGCPYEFLLHGEPTCDKRIYSFKDRLKLAYGEYMKQKQTAIETISAVQ